MLLANLWPPTTMASHTNWASMQSRAGLFMPARSPTGKEGWQEKGTEEREKRKQQCLDDCDASEFGLLGTYMGEAHGLPY